MTSEIQGARLGLDKDIIQTHLNAEIQQQLVTMLQQARDSVRISSPLLNPAIFNNEEIRAALSKFARRSRSAKVQILVSNAKVVGQRGHRLLELSRRLSTSVIMRKLDLAENETQSEYLLVDDCGVIEFGVTEKDPASINFCDRVRNKNLTEKFDPLWHKSRSPVELRRLVI
jgi:hypothetical protein